MAFVALGGVRWSVSQVDGVGGYQRVGLGGASSPPEGRSRGLGRGGGV